MEASSSTISPDNDARSDDRTLDGRNYLLKPSTPITLSERNFSLTCLFAVQNLNDSSATEKKYQRLQRRVWSPKESCQLMLTGDYCIV